MMKNKRIQLMACVVLAFLIAACANGIRPQVGPPWAQKLLVQGPKTDNPMFKDGWQDGCETGIATTSNALQRHFYSFKQDPEKAQNSDYYTAWKTAYWYCARYVMQYLRRQII